MYGHTTSTQTTPTPLPCPAPAAPPDSEAQPAVPACVLAAVAERHELSGAVLTLLPPPLLLLSSPCVAWDRGGPAQITEKDGVDSTRSRGAYRRERGTRRGGGRRVPITDREGMTTSPSMFDSSNNEAWNLKVVRGDPDPWTAGVCGGARLYSFDVIVLQSVPNLCRFECLSLVLEAKR